MPTINIDIKNKIATADETEYICGNDDFIVAFAFDAEWDEHPTKTARFVWDKGYQDIVFQGSQCEVPVISNTSAILCGVFTGNLKTTTPAMIRAKKSILCGNPPPTEATPTVFEQMLTLFNAGLDESRANVAAAEAYAKEAAALNAVWTGRAIQNPDTRTVSIQVYKNKDLCAETLYYRIQHKVGDMWSDSTNGVIYNGEAESSPTMNVNEYDNVRCLIFDGPGRNLYCILPVENAYKRELFMTSPDGTRFKITVNNDGTLAAAAVN